MNYTDDQLKQLLALMLPETVEIFDSGLLWRFNFNAGQNCTEVLDTELLHLCSLVEAEAGLNSYPLREKYLYKLMDIVKEDGRDTLVIFATWQQRTRALAAVKGVTL